MLRRTKDEKDEHGFVIIIYVVVDIYVYCTLRKVFNFSALFMKGVPIIELTRKECHVIKVLLSPEERDFYDALLRRSKAVCKRYDRVSDGHGKRNKYAALLTLLLHLRQACNHPFLVFGKSKGISNPASENNSSATAIVKKEEGGDESDTLGDDDSLLGQTFLNSILRKLQRSIRARSSDKGENIPTGELSPFATDIVQSTSAAGSNKDGGGGGGGGDDGDHDHDHEQQYECPICYETLVVGAEWISLSCGHRFCGDCIKASIERFKVCATCQQPLHQGDVVNVTSYLNLTSVESKETETKGDNQKPSVINSSRSNDVNDMLTSWRNWGDAKFKNGTKLNNVQQNYLNMNWRSSSKLEALMTTLETVFKRRLQYIDSSSSSSSSIRYIKPRKVVIFSQWTSMMDLIELAIQSHNSRFSETEQLDNSTSLSAAEASGPVRYVFTRLDGTMSQQQREIAVSRFNKDVDVNIFLVSLKLVLTSIVYRLFLTFDNMIHATI